MGAPSAAQSVVLSTVLNDYLRKNRSNRGYAEGRISSLAAADVSSEELLQISEYAQRESDWYGSLAAIPGLGAFAAGNISPPRTEAELNAELTALIAAVDGVVAELATTFPANGYLAAPPLLAGERNLQAYTPAQTAGLRTALQAVVDAIDP